MEPRLDHIDENEVLRYLQYHGPVTSHEILSDVARCSGQILDTARPRAVWRIFDWDPDRPLPGTDFTPGGQDIRRLLKTCSQVILFGATLGAEVDGLLRRAQIRSMADAVILDCCASAAVENVCDNLCADLAASLPGYLTDRFSPGYGDFPFAQQPEFCRVLDMSRRIGVNLTPGGLMIPQKTVTALLGRSDRPQPRRSRCESCGMHETCEFRKEGASCEN